MRREMQAPFWIKRSRPRGPHPRRAARRGCRAVTHESVVGEGVGWAVGGVALLPGRRHRGPSVPRSTYRTATKASTGQHGISHYCGFHEQRKRESGDLDTVFSVMAGAMMGWQRLGAIN